ncbi:unnamed protein product [Macrosiphum euphorbiae]|uniref:Uncharacterized protein n=1 Tax=Macrosiphum euphorbiae TaxID=13131 RepID=A0AAV0WQS2_9HEMI|nr:unnamed protein product [Macrosiphum euphorbiae]
MQATKTFKVIRTKQYSEDLEDIGNCDERIKTYLRNFTSEGRLNGLAMLSINKNDSITPDEVLVELSNKKRRLEFLL